ncbi:putative permease [Rubidibacter lacunae KORDI 51-2]|uniref:Putative permease n=1 Tax=Rubidibacter lacunae KORDI 51-2 TaxID=582515 RepID=U5DLT2_9CHRO|nr:permease [Rubidibacter lacunae]ERN40665.1 putative permease [Rubidibacter lacunae KORDI 51-2]
MERLHEGFTLFMSLVVEAMPFLLAGVILSSLMLLWIDERQLLARLPRHPLLGAMVGSLTGLLFPVCECGNIPVARRLLMQRAPASVAIAFLLAAPTVNPIAIWSTWVAFRDQPEIVVLRVVLSLIIAVTIACLFGVQRDARGLLQPKLVRRMALMETYGRERANIPSGSAAATVGLQSGTYVLGQSGRSTRLETLPLTATATDGRNAVKRRLELFANNVVVELRELGAMLILGSAIAAAIQVLAPRELVVGLGEGPVLSIVAMMLLAALVSICSTVDAFFALSFAATFTTGSLLAFLVFGPIVDIKAAGLLLSVFRPRVVAYIFAIAAQLTFLLTLAYTFLA